MSNTRDHHAGYVVSYEHSSSVFRNLKRIEAGYIHFQKCPKFIIFFTLNFSTIFHPKRGRRNPLLNTPLEYSVSGNLHRHSNEWHTYGSTHDVVRYHSNRRDRYTRSSRCVSHIHTWLSHCSSHAVQYRAHRTCSRSAGCSCRHEDLNNTHVHYIITSRTLHYIKIFNVA